MLTGLALTCLCCPPRPLLCATSEMGKDPLAGRFVPTACTPPVGPRGCIPALPTPFAEVSSNVEALGSPVGRTELVDTPLDPRFDPTPPPGSAVGRASAPQAGVVIVGWVVLLGATTLTSSAPSSSDELP